MEINQNTELLEKYRNKAKELVSKMTLEEKVSQTLHSAPEIERLGIKAYNWWNEALHGVARAGIATIFPQSIGLAATFDEDLLEKVADAISTEGRGKFNMQQQYEDRDIYKGLTFWAPNVNIFRDPRWGRGHETFGEDPYLTSRLGVRFVEGIQGHDEKHLKAAACAKHFAVHSGPEDIRHSFDARVSKQDMYETYLPAFKALVTEGKVEAVMGAYNRTNGEPCCGSKTLLKDILRDEWGFKGHVTSDCWAIKDFHEGHHVTDNAVDSVALAMNNGCDLNCGNIFVYLTQAVKEGKVDEKRLDEALVNLFTTRMKLGVMDEKEENVFDSIGYEVVDSKPMRELNEEVSSKCVVLLKNADNILPLDKNKIKTLAVVGPNANNRRALVGNYEGTASRYVTILEGLQDYLGDDVNIRTSEGCHLWGPKVENLAKEKERFSEVSAVCKESDAVICCLGLDSGLEGEEGDQGNAYASGDKPSLELPGHQNDLLQVCLDSGKPVIVVVLSGSALNLSLAQDKAQAVLQGWYPGAQGGKAISKILFGEKVPEGKLPVTFYKDTADLPDFKDYSMNNRTYRYMSVKPLYPFGYGLSYTDFEYSDLKVSSDVAGDMTATVTVKNTGKVDGTETVECYIKAIPDAKIEHLPNFSLKGIRKCFLKAGESREVTINLPKSSFELFNADGKPEIYKGRFEIYVGNSQPDERSYELTGKKPLCVTVNA